MTGYGVAETHTEKYTVKVEIKSLNGKYLDLNMRMPRFLMPKEIELRNTFGKRIERGSTSLGVHVIKHEINDNEIQINEPLAKQYYTKLKALSQQLDASDQDIFKITTGMHDVIYQDLEQLDPELYQLALQVGEKAFNEFDAFRKREGETLNIILNQYANTIISLIQEIEKYENERIEITKERIKTKLHQLMDDESFDENRFEQELIYYVEKFDINEEKIRLKDHCTYFCDSLTQNPKGKSLHFIAQEMGREINTLGSKANHAEIQKIVIAMKEELEKIKEQVLNLL